MTKIAVDQSLIEQAIEALTKSVWFCNHMGVGDWQPTAMACHRGIAALRASLAEPLVHPPGMAVQALAGEIVAALLVDEKDGGYDLTAGMFGSAFSELVRRWAAAELGSLTAPAVEPVAWWVVNKTTDEKFATTRPDDWNNLNWFKQPLYTSPPPAEPRISTEHCSPAERQAHQASVNYPSDDLYCPRCQCSERFLQSRRCEPHIVYDTPAEVPLLDDMNILRMWHETSSQAPMCNHYNHFARAIEQAVRKEVFKK